MSAPPPLQALEQQAGRVAALGADKRRLSEQLAAAGATVAALEAHLQALVDAVGEEGEGGGGDGSDDGDDEA